MKFSKALMIAALGLLSLNLVACASTPNEREPANQTPNDQMTQQQQDQNDAKMAEWQQRYGFGTSNFHR